MSVVDLPLRSDLIHGGNLPRGYRLNMADGDKPKLDPDQPVKIDLDAEDALKGLLDVDPDGLVEQDEALKDQGDELGDQN